MTVKMPYQCFIEGKFEDSENGKTYDTINPTDGSVSRRRIDSQPEAAPAHLAQRDVFHSR